MMRRLLTLLTATWVSVLTFQGCDGSTTEPESKDCYQQCRWVGDRFDCVTVCPQMGILFFWALCALLGAVILSRYDKAGCGCLLGLLLGPFGLLAAWVMRDSAAKDQQERWRAEDRQREAGGKRGEAREERDCPWCAEPILTKAKVCKHCGREVA